ncbi:hypothetical protein N7478_012471 [Penicillium angulare]|uniref:uncharacterized protein n=1 Tax=Penicillium angulare TaxID=116970 RepID=UPI00254257F6|nr:uncharacterized protein N7478_012471 [Penicillium angulare]KAJ5259490.1 hypothetical protein N7478_012471 [Penicillium angulare]
MTWLFFVFSSGGSHSFRLLQKNSLCGAHPSALGPKSIVPIGMMTASSNIGLVTNIDEPQFEQNERASVFPVSVALSSFVVEAIRHKASSRRFATVIAVAEDGSFRDSGDFVADLLTKTAASDGDGGHVV